MKIELRRPYKSIAELKTEELPDLAMLIGRNGAGKTQLLTALKGGSAEIPGMGFGEIELYDMDSFRPGNTNTANRNNSLLARITADAYLMSPHGGRTLTDTAAAIFEEVANDIECELGAQARNDFESGLRDDVRHTLDFEVFAARNQESLYKTKLHQQVLGPLQEQSERPSTHSSNSFNGNTAALLSRAMKQSNKLPHEVIRDDILRASHFEGDTISNSISEVFTAYKIDQFVWTHRRVETENIGFDELIAQYRSESRPPWEALREILSAMRDAAGDDGLFNFDFSDPDNMHLTLDNYERFSFRSEMTNRTTGTRYELDSLSSGERILMGLCLASFNHQYLVRRPPKLLLLDELDAVLHPSMVAALIETLKTLFIARGTRVLMTSHSPMTVAALDETDIFRVVRTGSHIEVFRTTKSEAINELSEGLATIDVGLKIAAYDKAKVTILSEGYNAKHLKRWAEINFPQDVHVFEDLEQHTSAGQLLTYGRLLGQMTTDTHFLVVWDCDARDKAETLRTELPSSARVTPFAFARRQENTIADRGIENNYNEDILKPFSFKKVGFDGEILGRGLRANFKTEFAKHVLRHGTPEYFTHFEDLHAIVSGILGMPSNPPCQSAPRD